MSWSDELGNVLKRYTSGEPAAEPAADVNEHFEQVAQSAPKSVLAEGLTAAFKSDRTPRFGQMLSTLFNNSTPDQKSGLINHLLQSLGPGALTQALSGSTLGGLLSGGNRQISPDQAQQISAEDVQRLGEHAEKSDPSIMNAVSSFYAQHSGLVKTLGGAALGIALSKVAERKAA